MTADKLQFWEKAPIVGLFIAQGAYVWKWYVGAAAVLPVAIVALAGIAAVASIDGAMVSTIAGMRQGRRSRWSVAAIAVTALFGALVALDLHGAIRGASAWLHAGFALTIVCYLLHLASPRTQAPRVAQGTRGRQRTLRALVGALRESRATAAAMTEAAVQARDMAARATGDAARLRDALRDAEERTAQAQGIDARTVAQWLTEAGVSGRQVAQRVGVSESTVRNWSKAPAQTAQAAD